MILEKEIFIADDFNSSTYSTSKQLIEIIDNWPEFRDELIRIFDVDTNNSQIIQIGNAKRLLSSIKALDAQCEKIDIRAMFKNIQLKKLLEGEKAEFEIFGVEDAAILKKNKSDLLKAETRYSAKSDILDHYHFSKFANYCHYQEYEDLIEVIKDYLQKKNISNEAIKKLRLVYKKEDEKFYLRAITSIDDYKDFGINFSVFVALMALNQYVIKTKNEIFISNYVVDDSNVYISFSFTNPVGVSSDLSLSFNLILENDEVKRNAVSFNALFKLSLTEKGKRNEIYLKPNGFVKKGYSYPTDLLTYPHRGSVESVFEKIKELPALIETFITQASEDSKRIASIKNPEDVKRLISDKIKYSKKPEFQVYKKTVFNKLMNITVNTTFMLFELLREVEELFQHDDIISRDFWRQKLYEALIERK